MEMSQPKQGVHSNSTVGQCAQAQRSLQCRGMLFLQERITPHVLLLGPRRQGLVSLCEACQAPALRSAHPTHWGQKLSERGFHLLSGSRLQQEEDKFLYAKAVSQEGKDVGGGHFMCICLASTGGLAAKHPVAEEEHLLGEQE